MINLEITYAAIICSLDLKKHSGCANALYTVQQVVNYYNERGSTIYMAALDACKAFDRINHSTLISKLVSRNMPQCVTDVIVNSTGTVSCMPL